MNRAQRFRILNRDGFMCKYCGRAASREVQLEIDHVHPRSLGGPDEDDNLVTSCFDCNRGKRNTVIVEQDAPREDASGQHPATLDGQPLSVWVHSEGFYVMISFGKAERTVVLGFTDAEGLGERLILASEQARAIMFPNKKSAPESPPPNVPPSAQ